MRHAANEIGSRISSIPRSIICFLLVSLSLHVTAMEGWCVVEFRSRQELSAYFDSIGYTQNAWENGLKEIPRVYIHTIPNRWTCLAQNKLPLQQKKLSFFMGIMPLVLKINESILNERQMLISLLEKIDEDRAWTSEERQWMENLATRYRVTGEGDELADPALHEQLMRRVDIIPPSMALAQAAYESGYGTSRFAGLGNALFGQWTWGENGITPLHQRRDLGNYKIAAFDTPLESVKAYAANLNCHGAYRQFRRQREALRQANHAISGLILADSLGSYSEKGDAYVEGLKRIIRANKLQDKDSAYLKAMPPVPLVPVDPRTCQPVL